MPTTRIARLGCSKNSAARSASARRADVTTTHGTRDGDRGGLLGDDRGRASGDGLRRRTGCRRLFSPCTATNTMPGLTRRESYAMPVHSTSSERASLTCAGRSCGGIARAKARNNSPTVMACPGPRRRRRVREGAPRQGPQPVADDDRARAGRVREVKRATGGGPLIHHGAVALELRAEAEADQRANGVARVHADEVGKHRRRQRNCRRPSRLPVPRARTPAAVTRIAMRDQQRRRPIQRRRHTALTQHRRGDLLKYRRRHGPAIRRHLASACR